MHRNLKNTSKNEKKACKNANNKGTLKSRFKPGENLKTVCQLPKKQETFDTVTNVLLSHSASEIDDPEKRFVIHQNITPIHYTICIKVNMEMLIMEGCVAIRCELKEDTSTINLNAFGFVISKVVWERDSGEERLKSYTYGISKTNQKLTITFNKVLNRGFGSLIINYKKYINESQLTGIFASKYHMNEHDDKQYPNLITRFTATDAKKCFPCFDDPLCKATFGISFVLPKNVTVIGNTDVREFMPHRTNREMHIVELDGTPKITATNLAFAIGSFEMVEKMNSTNNIVMRIYDRKLPEDQAIEFIFEACESFITFFQNYFDMVLPFDLISIILEEENHVTRGMKSFAFIILKEAKVAIDPKIVKKEFCQSTLEALMTISQGIIQQWLGCLVTLKWWSHLWFYEAMTTYLQYLSIDSLHPDQKMLTRFYVEVYRTALEADALSTHVLEAHVNNPAEIHHTFDSLSYNKGSSIIHMLSSYIGSTVFEQGLRTFIKTYSFGNASASDFWRILQEISGKPVHTMMQSWTKQLGYPLIRITSSRTENDNVRLITVHQEIFRTDSSITSNIKTNSLWIIPITITQSSSPSKVTKELLMDKRSLSFKLTNIGPKEWYKLNEGSKGFYRVKYPPEFTGTFLNAIRSKSMPPQDRIGLLNDTYALAESGISSCIEVLMMLESFSDEDNYFVWLEIDCVIGYLDLLLHSTNFYHNFKAFVRSLYKHIYSKVGWNTENDKEHLIGLLRDLIVTRLLKCDHQQCKDEGFERFEKMLLGEYVPVELKSVLYKAAMISGDNSTFQLLIKRFRTSESSEEKHQILESLGYSKNELILYDVLEFSLSEHTKHQEIIILKSVTSNELGRRIAWEFFKSRSAILVHHYPPGSSPAVNLLKTITECFSTEEMISEISEFFHIHKFYGSERIIAQSIEKIHNLVSWLKREKSSIADFLSPYE